MYKTIAAIALPILLLLLVGFAVWGFQVREERNTVLIKAENQYQRSFYELNDNLEQLHHELAKLQMLTVEGSQRKALANIWRLANLAQNDISQLPLTLLPFHETQQLLHNISTFAYNTTVRDVQRAPLTRAERNLLKRLYARTGEISTELRRVQTAIMSKQLRWMDVEIALAEENSKRDQSIIDGFKLVNKKVTQYDDLDFGPSVTMKNWMEQPLAKDERLLSEEVLKRKAAAIGDGRVIKTVRDQAMSKRAISQFIVKHRQTGERVTVQLSRRSGEPIWFLHARPVTKGKLDERQALKKAKAYIAKHKMVDMEFVSYDEYEHTASLTFVKRWHKTLIYPHKIVLKVALDNGEVIGLQADMEHATKASLDAKWRTLLVKQGLSSQQALALLGPDFKVQSLSEAIILDERRQPVHTYQIEGKFDRHVYRMFLSVVDGREVQAELLENVEI